MNDTSLAKRDIDPSIIARPDKTVVLVGMMGVGKSTIGKRLAQRLGIEFIDADNEIEKAAGYTIPEIFEKYGEPHFRDGERRVIARLLRDRSAHVLAAGGGAFNDADTRALAGERAISIWLTADIDILARRLARRGNRPMLDVDQDLTERLRDLSELRDPYYGLADIRVDTSDGDPEDCVGVVLSELTDHGHMKVFEHRG